MSCERTGKIGRFLRTKGSEYTEKGKKRFEGDPRFGIRDSKRGRLFRALNRSYKTDRNM